MITSSTVCGLLFSSLSSFDHSYTISTVAQYRNPTSFASQNQVPKNQDGQLMVAGCVVITVWGSGLMCGLVAGLMTCAVMSHTLHLCKRDLLPGVLLEKHQT